MSGSDPVKLRTVGHVGDRLEQRLQPLHVGESLGRVETGLIDGDHVERLHLPGAEVLGQDVEPLPGLLGLGQVAEQVEIADQAGAVDGERYEDDDRHEQRDDRAADDLARPGVPEPVLADVLGPAGPEGVVAQDGEEGGSEGQAGKQSDRDADGDGWSGRVVEA